jgi:hypothetical protein
VVMALTCTSSAGRCARRRSATRFACHMASCAPGRTEPRAPSRIAWRAASTSGRVARRRAPGCRACQSSRAERRPPPSCQPGCVRTAAASGSSGARGQEGRSARNPTRRGELVEGARTQARGGDGAIDAVRGARGGVASASARGCERVWPLLRPRLRARGGAAGTRKR